MAVRVFFAVMIYRLSISQIPRNTICWGEDTDGNHENHMENFSGFRERGNPNNDSYDMFCNVLVIDGTLRGNLGMLWGQSEVIFNRTSDDLFKHVEHLFIFVQVQLSGGHVQSI